MSATTSARLRGELAARFERDLELPPPTGPAMGLLVRLLAFYESQGVVQGVDDPPLWRVCRCASECWKDLPARYRPGRRSRDSWKGGILLPWVGPRYRRGGVAMLGVNLNHAAGGLLIEYDIALNGPYSQVETLSSGKIKAHNSMWAYRSARRACAVMRSIAAIALLDEPDPVVLAEVILSTARLQMVKCSPRDEARSARTPEMDRNCPQTFLARELNLVDPDVIVAFGDETWDALYACGTLRVTTNGPWVWRAILHDHGTRDREVVWLPHPSSRGDRWKRGHHALIRSLRRRPIASLDR